MHKVPYRCRLDAEFGTNFGFGKSVFFRLHSSSGRSRSILASIVVNYKLMKVFEADSKENVGRGLGSERGKVI